MPLRKASETQRGKISLERAPAGHQASSSGRAETKTPSINIAAYPHILSHILDNASRPTLSTLLRCSKSTLRSVAPYIYRNLRITSQQLAGMLEIGWAPSVRGSKSGLSWGSFSPFAKECLQLVDTLHLLNYDPKIRYEKVPRGLFSNNRTIILYPNDDHYISATFLDLCLPTTLSSLGASHLYVRLSELATYQKPRSVTQWLLSVTNALPRNIASVTFLFPFACRLPRAPLCSFAVGLSRACDTTVVLLPWRHESQDRCHQESMLERWSTPPQISHSLPESDAIVPHSTYVGSEYVGPWSNTSTILGQPDPSAPSYSFAKFRTWLDALPPDTVFDQSEYEALMFADMRLIQELGVNELKHMEQELDRRCAEGADPKSPEIIRLREQLAGARGLLVEGEALWASCMASRGD